MKISSIRDLKQISNKIKKKLTLGDVVFLYGEIGVGKTTFARLLINNYEKEKKLKESEVLSPTFNIVFEYDVKEFTIKHYDLYRLKSDSDIKKTITLIEWPKLIKKKPLNRIDLFFEHTQDMNERLLIIKTSGRLKNYEF